ncbi:TonB-dependent receptor [Pedobacter heparinus]|uniref:TonB-dependent receptor n=1 Tax=Pedobacter heparinus TaxID=984 RepID=UPI00292CD766|nr:TonB-dependent receptor [Pedobacter heparinus]
MKLIVILLTTAIMQLSASSFAQRITLNKVNAPLSEIVNEIRIQSGYDFLYNNTVLKASNPVTISVRDASIEKVLAICFDNQPLTYTISDNFIVIKRGGNPKTTIAADIRGKVTDEKGAPLPGASVKVKGATQTTSTNTDGEFTLRNVEPGAVLTISFLGFVTQDVAVGNRSQVSVVLIENSSALNELVVVGYGTQQKINLTGAVSTVDSKSIENRPVSNLAVALQGTSPGLVVTRTSGQPGNENVMIQLRGATSANGNVNPLLVVDGVSAPISTLQSLNPNDIDNVTLLKDAAAAAIYGAQAAGGVILVTTKKGVAGKTKIEYANLFGVDQMLNVPQRMSLLDEANFSNLSAKNAGLTPAYTDAELQMIRDRVEYYVSPSDTNKYIYLNQHDFVDQTIRKTTAMQTHNISASGGTDKLNFLVSLGAYAKDGAFKVGPDKYNRYNGRINLGASLSKYVSFDTKISYTRMNTEMPSLSVPTLLYQTLRLRQKWPIFTPEGRLSGEGGISANQAYAYLKEGGYDNQSNHNFDGIFSLKVADLVKGLQLRAIYGATYNRSDRDLFSRRVELWQRYFPVGYINQTNKFEVTQGQQQNNNLQFLVNYAFNLGPKHHFELLGGYQFEDSRVSSVYTSSQNLASNDLPALVLGDDATKTNSQSINTYAYQSYFGRINYNYESKYLFEATLRTDESSRLAPGLRIKTFPSLSAGWNIHKEKWFPANSFVSSLRMRASWGQLGSALGNVIGNYDFMNMLSRSNALVLGASEDRARYFYQNVVPSSSLTWETVETTNGGLDFGLFNNKLSVNADYYVKFNRNMLTPLQLPVIFGVATPRTNNGELKSWGWEIEASYRDQIGSNFSYFAGFNLSDNKNKVISYAGRNVVGAGIVNILENYPLGSIWGYQTDGYYQSQQEVTSAPFYNTRTGVGDVKYLDQNADHTINNGGGVLEDRGDLVYLGTEQPRYNFGINGGFNWKGFDFSIFLQGVGSRTFYATVNTINPQVTAPRQPLDIHKDYWTEENRNAAFPRPYSGGQHNYVFSDKWMLDGKYIRLKNIQLGFSLPEGILKKAHVSRARIYFSGQDLLTVTRLGIFSKIFNPEYSNNVDFDYPFAATASVGINVTF